MSLKLRPWWHFGSCFRCSICSFLLQQLLGCALWLRSAHKGHCVCVWIRHVVHCSARNCLISTIFISRSFYLTATFRKCTRAISPILLCIHCCLYQNCIYICSGNICDPHSNRINTSQCYICLFQLLNFTIFSFPYLSLFGCTAFRILSLLPLLFGHKTYGRVCVFGAFQCKMKWHLRIFQVPAVTHWCKMRPLRQRIKCEHIFYRSTKQLNSNVVCTTILFTMTVEQQQQQHQQRCEKSTVGD